MRRSRFGRRFARTKRLDRVWNSQRLEHLVVPLDVSKSYIFVARVPKPVVELQPLAESRYRHLLEHV